MTRGNSSQTTRHTQQQHAANGRLTNSSLGSSKALRGDAQPVICRNLDQTMDRSACMQQYTFMTSTQQTYILGLANCKVHHAGLKGKTVEVLVIIAAA